MFINKTIGIWGLGKVGTSAAHFLHAQGATVIGMDKTVLALKDISDRVTTFFTEEQKEHFFAQADYILASPGIDTRLCYVRYKEKWITELDLFYHYWKKPIIAVTGSVGKTTITTILGQLLTQYGITAAVGGNIGKPMLSIINKDVDIALLEVSSFQLEHCALFAPDLALWTNFVPNHLDRHTMEEYFNAKTRILAHQKEHQTAMIPFSLFQRLRALYPLHKYLIVVEENICASAIEEMTHQGHSIIALDKNMIMEYRHNAKKELIDITLLPKTTFLSNWIFICAVLNKFGCDLSTLPVFASTTSIPEHRMEKITHGEVIFYNDSKATTPVSTLSAIKRLNGQEIILFLGGLSKGVDRSEFIRTLQGKVQRIYCFGKEAPVLHTWCNSYSIQASAHATLDEAFHSCMLNKRDQEVILFSPSGSSYDLFRDYEERGNHFKQLITNYFK